jgi:hypothetical protein
VLQLKILGSYPVYSEKKNAWSKIISRSICRNWGRVN